MSILSKPDMAAHLASVFVAIFLAAVPFKVFYKVFLVVLQSGIDHGLKNITIQVFVIEIAMILQSNTKRVIQFTI